MGDNGELKLIDAIYDAFDRDDPAAAWELAQAGLDAATEDDPVLHFLAGRALVELERPGEAAEQLGRAVTLDPQDPEFRVHHAWALFRACRFAEAEREIEQAEDSDQSLPEFHHVHALCLERAGRVQEAERHFARAAELDPIGFPRPARFSDGEFGHWLDAARQGLSDDFRRQLDGVTLIVEDLPSEALLREDEPPLDPEQLLGLFSGPPLGEPTSLQPGGELPPRIHLFKRNLERVAADGEELAEQIRITLYHELGHYLGLGEDELEGLGYG